MPAPSIARGRAPREAVADPAERAHGARRYACARMATDTKGLIDTAVRRFLQEVPALAQLKLVTRLELRGRGDIQLYRVQMPGPVIAKDPAGDAKVTLSIPRSHFNELAAEGKVKHWRDAFESGVARASGPPEILRLIVNVVERQEERSRTRHAKRR